LPSVGLLPYIGTRRRPFAINELLQRGWSREQISVVRELVDVMYLLFGFSLVFVHED